MTAKTDLINNLRNSGIDLAESTLKRKSMAELETIWSALQDRDAAAQQAADDGKVQDLNNSETDCGGCENGECDGCGNYECCAEEDITLDRVADAIERSQAEDVSVEVTTDMVFEIAAMHMGPGEIGAELAKAGSPDGQSKNIKDRDNVTTMLETLKEIQKVVTAAGYRKDPVAMRAALSALAEQAKRTAEAV